MKVCIIGAGFTGLSCAYQLAKKGYKVTVFEKEKYPGGLAVGFKDKNWAWTMEKHYHHFFTNDNEILNLARELNHKVIIKKPKTSVYLNGKIIQLDSPLKVLLFKELTFTQRVRMAFAIAFLRYNPFWKLFEKIKIVDFLPKIMGEKTYKKIWEPQIIGKFGSLANEISLAWFWARIKKRTTKLAYPEGGFSTFANSITEAIKKMGGIVNFEHEVISIEKNRNIKIIAKNKKKEKIFDFDKVIFTLPSNFLLKIVKKLPKEYEEKVKKLKSIGAINLVLKLKKPFFEDNTYWLSFCDKSSLLIAIVEHTNFMDKKFYNQEYLVYVGKYLDNSDPFFTKDKNELLGIYDLWLKKINKEYRENLIDYYLFKDPFAQPIVDTDYHKNILPSETPIEGLYLANIEQIYPWDRGTNYAVELGNKIAKMLINAN